MRAFIQRIHSHVRWTTTRLPFKHRTEFRFSRAKSPNVWVNLFRQFAHFKCYTINLRPICARFRHPEQTPSPIEIAAEYCAHTICGYRLWNCMYSFWYLENALETKLYTIIIDDDWIPKMKTHTHEMCGIHFSVCTIVLRLCVFYSTLFFAFRFRSFHSLSINWFRVSKCLEVWP